MSARIPDFAEYNGLVARRPAAAVRRAREGAAGGLAGADESRAEAMTVLYRPRFIKYIGDDRAFRFGVCLHIPEGAVEITQVPHEQYARHLGETAAHLVPADTVLLLGEWRSPFGVKKILSRHPADNPIKSSVATARRRIAQALSLSTVFRHVTLCGLTDRLPPPNPEFEAFAEPERLAEIRAVLGIVAKHGISVGFPSRHEFDPAVANAYAKLVQSADHDAWPRDKTGDEIRAAAASAA